MYPITFYQIIIMVFVYYFLLIIISFTVHVKSLICTLANVSKTNKNVFLLYKRQCSLAVLKSALILMDSDLNLKISGFPY